MATADPQPAVITRSTLEEVYGETPKKCSKPPHHLLETQIFPNLHKNEIFQVEPEQLSFIIQQNSGGKKLRVVNTSSTRQNFHVIEPLNNKIWSISYRKPDGGLVPGGNVEINVKFRLPSSPDSTSIYQDSIRLHCTGGNLLIPLYAYPTIDTTDFPEKINFGSVPLGQETIRTISLKAPENESFDYSCTVHPISDTFDVQPSYGTIAGEVQISVSYRPTEFITSSANLQIIFSTFDRKMLRCKINGNCLPGLLTLKKKKEFELNRKKTKPTVGSSTKETSDLLARLAREQSTKLRKKLTKKKVHETPKPKIIPGAQHHVNKILISDGKSSKKHDLHDQIYLEKSKAFREKLRESIEAEKINKLRWQIRVGDEIPSFEELDEVRRSRSTVHSRVGNRTEREANSLPSSTPNFDPYRNSPWRARHVALGQFQQAARTILIRIRGENRLAKLRKLMKLVNTDGLSIEEAETNLLAAMGRQIKQKNKERLPASFGLHSSGSSAANLNQNDAGKHLANDAYEPSIMNDTENRPDENKSFGNDDTEEEALNNIKHLKIRSKELNYNDVLTMLRPNERLTRSCIDFNFPDQPPTPVDEFELDKEPPLLNSSMG